LFILTGCSGKSYYEEIEVSKTSRIRSLTEFNSLSISGNFEVTINAQSTQKVEIIANDDILPYVTTKVKNKNLHISTSKDLGKITFVELKISMKDLKEVNVSGIADVIAKKIKSDKLTINVSGAADLTLKGSTDKFELNVSGASDVNAKNLKSNTVDINISGAADVIVNAIDELDVDISGAGEIEYTGSPNKVSKDVSGIGNVKKIK